MMVHGILNMYLKIKIRRLSFPSPVLDNIEVLKSSKHLPDGVTVTFSQFLDDYLDPDNADFTRWVWWENLEEAFARDHIRALPTRVMGGLSHAQEAWDTLRQGKTSG